MNESDSNVLQDPCADNVYLCILDASCTQLGCTDDPKKSPCATLQAGTRMRLSPGNGLMRVPNRIDCEDLGYPWQ